MVKSNSIPGISSHHCDTIVSNSQPKSSSVPSTSTISKYLVQYVAPPPAKKDTTNTRVTGSQVLTSAEGYAILHEKEEKKKKEKKKRRNKKEYRRRKKKTSWPRRKPKRKPGKYHTKRNSQNIRDQSL